MPKSDRAGSRVTAAEVLAPVLERQVKDLRAWEAKVRLDEPHAIHEYRVAARRLRSSLAGFGPLLDAEPGRRLREDLRLAAATVSGARDTEVVRRRVDALLRDEPEGGVVDRAGALLTGLLQHSYRASLAASLDHLDSPEYDAFVRRLERFADLPPWTDRAGRRADRVLEPLLRHEWTRVRKRAKRSLQEESGPAQDERMHDARKAAKRVRYLCESLEPLFGRKAHRMAKAALRVQTVLGDYHDCVLTRQLLASAREQARADPEVGELLARLQEREAATAAGLREEFARLVVVADRPGLRRWLE